jgi:elongation factor G
MQLQGAIDFLEQAAIHSRTDSSKWQQQPVPDRDKSVVAEARKKIQEAAAEADDQLLERYLTVGELTPSELMDGLRVAVQAGAIVPLYAGSAVKNIGIVPLLNALAAFLPSPVSRTENNPLIGHHPETAQELMRLGTAGEPFSGLIFKTIIDPFVGRLSYLRVLSGTLQSD